MESSRIKHHLETPITSLSASTPVLKRSSLQSPDNQLVTEYLISQVELLLGWRMTAIRDVDKEDVSCRSGTGPSALRRRPAALCACYTCSPRTRSTCRRHWSAHVGQFSHVP